MQSEHKRRSTDRVYHPLLLSVTNDIETTGSFSFRGFAGGQIVLAAGLSTTLLTFYARATPDGTMGAAKTDEATPAAITRVVAAGDSIPIPKELFGAYEIAIVSDDAGPETLEILLKS